MKEVKIWAKKYFIHSPLFKSDLFRQPHHQQLMRINPNLLSAYTLGMFKHYHYDHRKVMSILDEYYPQENHYSVQSVRYLLNHHQKQQNSSTAEEKYKALLFKLFQKHIQFKEFKELAQLYVALKQEDKLRQFDDFVLDQCFYQIYQLTIFCELPYSGSLDAIESQSIHFLEKRLEKTFLIGIYSLVTILNRIKDKLGQHPKLKPYSAWLQPRANFKSILSENQHARKFLLRQSLSYMLWLLRLNQLGKVVQRYTKQNYVYSSYIDNSIQIIGSLLQIIQVHEKISIHQLLVLNQVVYEVQNIQQVSMIFEDIKRTIALELLVINMKRQINNELIKHAQRHQSQLEHFEWLQKVNMFPLDYISFTTRTFIKQKIQFLLSNSQLAHVLNNHQLITLVQLCRKIDHYSLAQRVQNKIKERKGHHHQDPNLLNMLELYYATGKKIQCRMEISNIYELKRIKNLLEKIKISEKECAQFSLEQKKILLYLQQELNNECKGEIKAELKPLFNLFLR